MKRIWGTPFLLLLASCTLTLAAAQNSHSFALHSDVQVGDLRIAQGQYDVSWVASGFQVRLTLKADGKKPISLRARVIAEKHNEAGVTTFAENGVTYLQDFHTTTETFILSGTPSAPK